MEQTEKQKEWKAKHYEDNKDAYRTKQQNRRKEIKEFVDSHKTKCVCCGDKDIVCLDFHHVDKAEKEDTIPTAMKNKWGEERILKEIKKCVVLCSNCHRKLHYYDLTIDELKLYINKK